MKNIYLLYDSSYIDKKNYINKISNDDLIFCVSNERIEEIIEFSRYNLNIIPTEKIDNFKFNENDIVFVRTDINKKIKEKIKDTILYKNQFKKYNNLEYWWRFISPKNRKITEFKLLEIYDNFPKEWKRNDLKELLTKPVFIKTVKKRPISKLSHWTGNDYLDSLQYDIEMINLDEDLIASPLIERNFDEYRCWVLNSKNYKRVLNISRYTDFYYLKIDEEIRKEALVENFIKEYIFKNKNIDNFPKIFVVDVLYSSDDYIDIVEFNNYEIAGRYIYNTSKSIIEALNYLLKYS